MLTMLTDTREILPLDFPLTDVVTGVRKATLPVGDYGCEYADGSRPPIFFERKSVGDLWGTLVGKDKKGDYNRERFKREILLAQHYGYKLVLIVETPLARMYDGFEFSEYPGATCVKQVFTLWAKYGLQPVFCQSRDEMADYIVQTFSAVGRCWKAGPKIAAGELFGGMMQQPLDLAAGEVGGLD